MSFVSASFRSTVNMYSVFLPKLLRNFFARSGIHKWRLWMWNLIACATSRMKFYNRVLRKFSELEGGGGGTHVCNTTPPPPPPLFREEGKDPIMAKYEHFCEEYSTKGGYNLHNPTLDSPLLRAIIGLQSPSVTSVIILYLQIMVEKHFNPNVTKPWEPADSTEQHKFVLSNGHWFLCKRKMT